MDYDTVLGRKVISINLVSYISRKTKWFMYTRTDKQFSSSAKQNGSLQVRNQEKLNIVFLNTISSSSLKI